MDNAGRGGLRCEGIFSAGRQEDFVIAAIDRPRLSRPSRFLDALTVGVVWALSLIFLAAPVLADCGDSIDGERIPCRCGDIVIADTRLQPDDPVVTERCPADGLLVRAPVQARTVVVDLNGQELRGSGVGTGVRILHGGVEGATIVGGVGAAPGVIAGFREGIRSTRPDDLRLLTNVVVRESRDAGVVVRGSRASIESVRVEGNGGDGLRASGRSVDLFGLEADGNGGRGVRDRARAGERDVTSQSNRVGDAGGGRTPR
jgi:hypothetical protein